MYVKTNLRIEGIEDLADADNPAIYLSLLRETSVLVLQSGDVGDLSRILPTTVWSRLKDDILKKRQLVRVNTEVPSTSAVQPDVVVSSQEPTNDSRPYGCRLIDLPFAPPIEQNALLRRGELGVSGRDEFWKYCLRPSIESLSPPTPTIEYFDSYVFSDAAKVLEKKNRNGSSKDSTDTGAGWLISRIETLARELHITPELAFYTQIGEGMGGKFSEDDIKATLTTLVSRINVKNIKVKLFVFEKKFVERQSNKDLKDALHSRSLILDRHQRFRFNFGLKDLNLRWDDKSGVLEDAIAGNWHWQAALSDNPWKVFFYNLNGYLKDASSFIVQ
jgi:hypothetical protein